MHIKKELNQTIASNLTWVIKRKTINPDTGEIDAHVAYYNNDDWQKYLKDVQEFEELKKVSAAHGKPEPEIGDDKANVQSINHPLLSNQIKAKIDPESLSKEAIEEAINQAVIDGLKKNGFEISNKDIKK